MSVTHFKPQRYDLKIVLIEIFKCNHNICDNGYIYNKQNFGLYWVK